MHIPERDWKVFRGLHAVALERHFQQLLDQAIAEAQDTSKPLRDRYNDFYYAVRDRDKTLRDTFDDLRRSTAILKLMVSTPWACSRRKS